MSRPPNIQGQAPASTDLWASLEQVLTDYFGEPLRIVRFERCASAYRTSFALEELELDLDDGRSLHLMFKNVSRQALIRDARRAKPRFLFDPLREIETYRTILAPSQLTVPTCYGAEVDPTRDRYWLFLEYVSAWTLAQVDELLWVHAAQWLGRMHAQFAQTAGLQERARIAHLLHYDADFYRRWARRAGAFARRNRSKQSANAWHAMDRIIQRYDLVVERLLALPPTFIHGEFFASNVLVQSTPDSHRVCPVDWEMAALGPGLIDLAALTAGEWTAQQRETLVSAYRSVLPATADSMTQLDDFVTDLNCCRLHLAMQWLGWSPVWTPPPEDAQNWLDEAVRLAERLGL